MANELIYIVLPVHSRGAYNTVPYLDDCMKTLKEHTNNFRMIFVDDYCDEEGSRAIERHARDFPESYIVRTFKQRWFTRAVNLGLRFVRSPWAVVLNSDTVLGAGWLDELCAVRDEVAGQGHKVGLVGSVLSAEEPRRYGLTSLPSTPGNPGYVTGHCWLVNMYALFEASSDRGMPGWYLDECSQQCIHIYSDNEICARLNKLGWATAMSFKSAVGHHGGKSWHHDLGRAQSVMLQQVNDF